MERYNLVNDCPCSFYQIDIKFVKKIKRIEGQMYLADVEERRATVSIFGLAVSIWR